MVASPLRALLTSAAVSVAATLAAPAAHADTLKMVTTTYGHRDVDTSMTGVESIGQYVAEWNGTTFATYCTDIFEPFAFNTTYTDYRIVPTGGDGGFTTRQADLLGKLYTVADNGMDSKVDSLDETVAFQLAVWEVMNETHSKLRVSGTERGAFYVESGAPSAVVNLANSWLRAAQQLGSSDFNVVRLVSKGSQDMMLVSAVPEPGTFGLMGAGLAAVAALLRRRRSPAK